LAGVPACLADVSLILPGVTPKLPISANIIGVGPDGATTYQIFPGQPTGSLVNQNVATAGTVKMVEDDDNVVLEYANSALSVTVVKSCALASGMGNCVNIYGQTTVTTNVTATAVLVQGGGTVSSEPTVAASSAFPAQTTSVPGSTTSASPAATQSAPLPSNSASSGIRLTPTKAAGLAGMLVIWAVLA